MANQRNTALGTYSLLTGATGRKKYGGGTTFSPTMGQVDKSGYRDRDMRIHAKKVAMMGALSDRKKGALAGANALKMRK